ncbi:polyketide synthase dehydratase domain-containing protein [Desulfobacula sp.]|uniref:polyketide synthase dehydratase domain-containing protein n=1 Tax=Desulfobacula sp. TaxID=2593537 RepID=UPI002605E7BB|nr:polyketide synthase dehydratase domain-containing protein [Desulfobacula sp.]
MKTGQAAGQSFSLINNSKRANTKNGQEVEIAKTFEPDQDIYLKNHTLDGKPVLPAAMAMELMKP